MRYDGLPKRAYTFNVRSGQILFMEVTVRTYFNTKEFVDPNQYIVSVSRRPQHLHPSAVTLAIPVAAIVAVAKAVFDYLKERQGANWQNQVSDQLDEILTRLVSIEQKLADLMNSIDQKLDAAFLESYYLNLKTAVQNVNGVLSAIGSKKPNASQIERLNGYLTILEQEVGKLISKEDYCHIEAVISGGLCILAINNILGNDAELPGWKRRLSNYVKEAVDNPENSRSFAYVRNKLAAEYTSKIAGFQPLFGRAWQLTRTCRDGHARGPDGYVPSICYSMNAILSGSLIEPISLVVISDGGDAYPWFPLGRDRMIHMEGDEARQAALNYANSVKNDVIGCANHEKSVSDIIDYYYPLIEKLLE